MTQLLNDELASGVMNSVKSLAFYRKSNANKKTYFDGKNCLSNLSIFLDDNFGSLGVSLPWGKLAVTALHDRMEVEAVVVDDEEDNEIIQKIIEDNYFLHKIRETIFESLLFGAGYMLVGPANKAVSDSPLITSESPNTTYGEYDASTRMLKSLLKVKIEKDEQGHEMLTYGELFLPHVILYFSVKSANNFQVISLRQNPLGYVPSVKFINAEDGSLGEGSSEISHTVRALIDYGQAQFANMRVASDAFAQPTQYIIGVGGDKNINGQVSKPVKLSRKAGTLYTIPFARGIDGSVVGTPQVGQLAPGSPDTYIKIAESLVKQLSLATRIPDSQLGFSKSMPSSAEAIKNEEQPFVRRIQKKEKIFSEPIEKIIRIAYQMKTGRRLEGSVHVKWVEVGTQTLASNTDAVTKAITAGSVSPTSDWVYEKLGVPYAERQKIRDEMKASTNSSLFQSIIAMAEKSSAANPVLAIPSGETLEAMEEVDVVE